MPSVGLVWGLGAGGCCGVEWRSSRSTSPELVEFSGVGENRMVNQYGGQGEDGQHSFAAVSKFPVGNKA